MTSVLEVISHYQKSIENSTNDQKRLLHCLAKLYKLPITVQHLQETGIGRTVNCLRKDDGEVGVAAKTLVMKWKAMVAADESSEDEGGGEENGQNDVDNHEDKNSSSDNEVSSPPPPKPTIDSEKRHSTSNHKESVKPHSRKRDSEAHTSSDQRKEKHRGESERSSSHRKHGESKDRKNSSHSSSHHKKRRHSSDGDNEINLDVKKEKLSDSEKSSSSREKEKERERERRERKEKEREKRGKESSRSHSHHHTSSSSSKVKEESKSSSHHHKSSSSSHNSSKNKDKEEVKPIKKEEEKPSASSSKKKEVERTKRKKIVSDDEGNNEDDDGFNNAGASFADALGMLEMPSTSKSLSKKKPQFVTPTIKRTEKKVNVVKPSTSKSTAPLLLAPTIQLAPLEPEINFDTPTVSISNNYKPMPLNPIIMDCVFSNSSKALKKAAFDEEELSASISSKNTRTKVYSGVKSGALNQCVPLYDLCLRILQKNIDALEYTGGVPFDILKPVLERATPQQLFHFEHFNPYLMDDSDLLWEHHCKIKFRSKRRQEMETWRELYMRCLEEQDARLASLTENIKISQGASLPVKQTKLAYVDSAVKPPRGIQRKQIQYGTERKLIATPASRVAALCNLSNNIAKTGDARLKVIGGGRDTAQAVGSIFKPRKAPLMAKTIQAMKSRFKR